MPVPTNSAQSLLDAGRKHHAQGQLREAAAAYERVLAAEPSNPDALHLLGVVAFQQGRNEVALALMDRALDGRPVFPEALNNRGNALKALGRLDDAARSYQAAIDARPDYMLAHFHLGVARWEQGRFEDAETSYRHALALDPRSPVIRSNLGGALRGQHRFDEAEAEFRASLSLDPRRADAHAGLADLFSATGRLDEALAAYDRALSLQPDHLDARLNRGILLLSMGRYEQGWADHEHRRRHRWVPVRKIAGDEWRGEPLAGRTLFCHTEQGLGDTVQFVRFAALAARDDGRVVVEVQPALVPLMRTVAGIEVVPRGAPDPQFDVSIPLLSMPYAMGVALSDLPMLTRYISADPERVAFWRQRLPEAPLRVGIVWQGDPAHREVRRSFPLSAYAPLLDIDGVTLVSLQKGAGTEQLAEWDRAGEVVTLGDDFDGSSGAFMDTVAVMESLDLVITCDTSVAHVAGALGVETWVVLRTPANWRWLWDRSDSPWYPGMRLFRQERLGDWRTVMDEVAAALVLRLKGDAS